LVTICNPCHGNGTYKWAFTYNYIPPYKDATSKLLIDRGFLYPERLFIKRMVLKSRKVATTNSLDNKRKSRHFCRLVQ
jgi:hypothetical protein